MRSSHLIAIAVLAVAAASPRAAAAQAWLPEKGEGSIAVLYQDVFVSDHFFDRGQRRDRGEIQTNNLLVDFTYGLTDRLTVTFGVPFVRSEYSGLAPHPTAQDDGRAHYGFQDFRFSARYNVVQGEFSITPFVGVNLPSHAYEYFAHASLGPRVREVEVGTYVGRILSPALPKAFVQARYSYGFAQEIVGVDHNRSNLDIEVGYFVTQSIRVFTMGMGSKTHGGIAVPEAGWRVLPPEQGPHHDRIGRIDLLDVGGGVQVSLTKTFDVFASFTKSLAGRNTHAIDRAISVGASWSFGRNLRSLMMAGEAETGGADRQLGKCLCQK